MAFTPETFVLCSKFNLFKAHANLWIYTTHDTLEDCLAEHYFQPRLNLKNQDSPEVGDVIQLIVEDSKLAYLKIVGKTEKPYYITVARTFLENEATLIAEITALQLNKADKTTDFATPITDENLGITQAEQTELEQKIDLAANSGRMITPQGFWYAKMYSATVPPSAEDGTNYADFSQTDNQGNPIIVTYNRVSGAWVQDQIITPPTEYDGYVPITSKIWDIAEQDGQQGGRVLWNHTSKLFTPYPTVVSFDSIEITGDSTVTMPVNPDSDNIANVEYVLNHFQTAGRNIGDIFFTCRKDNSINGAVPCDGATYDTSNFIGAQSPGNLLASNKLPYVSLATYASMLAQNGSVGVFGWDGINTTTFRVPTLTDVFVETGIASQVGDYMAPGLPNITGDALGHLLLDEEGLNTRSGAIKITSGTVGGNGGGSYPRPSGNIELDASFSSRIYGSSQTVQPNAVRYRAMIQLSVGTQDQSYGQLATVAYSGSYNDLLNTPTLGTAAAANTTDFATAAQGTKADTAVQPADIANVVYTNTTQTISGEKTFSGKLNYCAGMTYILAGSGGAKLGYWSYDIDGQQNITLQTMTASTRNINFKTNNGGKVTYNGIEIAKITDIGTPSNMSSSISNCLTKIPQDINLELDNGTLTLKAGSKVHIANGDLDVIDTTTADISVTNAYNGQYMVIRNSATSLYLGRIESTSSGQIANRPSSTPNSSGFYFATDENRIYLTGNSGSTWYSGGSYTLPLAIITVSNGAISSIDQVFNGFGYIGSTVFALPGIEGLAPNGRNADGTLKNISFTVSSVRTNTLGSSTFDKRVLYLGVSSAYGFSTTLEYLPDTNTFNNAGQYVIVGWGAASSGVITNLELKTAFHAVDYNDLESKLNAIIENAMGEPDWANQTQISSGDTMSAKGWVYGGTDTGDQGGWIQINGTYNVFSTTSTHAGTAKGIVPVAKGDTITYGNGTFYFVPCKPII